MSMYFAIRSKEIMGSLLPPSGLIQKRQPDCVNFSDTIILKLHSVHRPKQI